MLFKVISVNKLIINMGCSSTKQHTVLILVGSARQKSINSGLVEQIQHFLLDQNLNIKLIIPDLEKLPIFCSDIEKQMFLPDQIKNIREKASRAESVLFVTPEVNGSASALILNAFLWLSRIYSEKGSPLRDKKAGVLSASYLSENQIIDCIQLGRELNMDFFKEHFYLFLGNKVVNQQGQLTSVYEKGRLEEWYKKFLAFIVTR